MTVDIVIRAINEASGEITKVNVSLEGTETAAKGAAVETKKVGLSMTDVNSAMQIGKQVIDAVGQAYGATVGKSQAYAASIRSLKAITGGTAEETSRLIQVVDDYEISTEDLTASMRVLTKNGLVPNRETIIGLAKEYQSIQDPLAKNEFLVKNLGRASVGYTNLLSQNTDELERNFDAVNANLILNEKQLAQAEQLRLAQDNLNDTLEGLSITVGAGLTPILSDWLTMIDTLTKGEYDHAQAIQNTNGLALIPMIGTAYALNEAHLKNEAALKAKIAAEEEAKVAGEALTETEEQLAAAAQKVLDANRAMASTIQSMQNAEDAYNEKVRTLADERAAIMGRLEELRKNGSIKNQEAIQAELGKLDQLKNKEKEIENERARQTKQFISDMLLQQLAVGGLTTVELREFAKQQVAWGLWSKDIQDKALAAQKEAQKVVDTIAAIENKTVTLTVNTVYTPSSSPPPPGAGGLVPRAAGGPVEVGKAYLVGEKQPEMFVPWTNGTIIPSVSRSGFTETKASVSTSSNGNTYIFNAYGSFSQSTGDLEREFISMLRKAQADGLIPVGR